jgi:hypothetical protein
MELETLLKKCKQNNIAAQRALYEQYAGALFLVCRRYVKTDEPSRLIYYYTTGHGERIHIKEYAQSGNFTA